MTSIAGETSSLFNFSKLVARVVAFRLSRSFLKPNAALPTCRGYGSSPS